MFLDLPQDRPDAQPATLRALGRRVDPETGAVYHLDYDPPPEDEPGLAERLRDLVPPNLADVEKRLAEWSRGAEDLESWFAQFPNLRVDVVTVAAQYGLGTAGSLKEAHAKRLKLPMGVIDEAMLVAPHIMDRCAEVQRALLSAP